MVRALELMERVFGPSVPPVPVPPEAPAPPTAERSPYLRVQVSGGLTWELELRRERPGRLEGCELVSTLTNHSGRGLALPCWGPTPGLHFHFVTGYGQLLFDAGHAASCALAILPDGDQWIAHIPLDRRPLRVIEEWKTPPVRELAGLVDPWLEHEDHLWLVVSQHQVRGPTLRAEPLLLPLRRWLRGGPRSETRELFGDGDMDRLACTDLIYRPGRLLVGFSHDSNLEAAQRAVDRLGYRTVSSRLFEAARVLAVDVPRGREEQAVAAFDAAPGARMVTREPIACGPLA